MKNFFNIFFVTLGVIFLILILVGILFFVTDPFNLKPMFSGGYTPQTSGEAADKHPLLNESQEQALEAFGIGPATIPTEISPEQEACFESKLGKERVDEIKAGDTPTMSEYFQARECI